MDMFEWIKSNVGGVDICINNAGVAQKANLLGPGKTIYFFLIKQKAYHLNKIAETTADKLRITKLFGYILENQNYFVLLNRFSIKGYMIENIYYLNLTCN